MANENNYIGIAMGLDVSDLKSGLSEANKQIQLANSQFKAASSGMEDWTKSAEGLNAKITHLSTVFDLQKKKLSGLEAEYNRVVAAQGENSEAARKLQVQINNQKSVVNSTERELSNYKETLKLVEDGTVDLEKVTLKAGKAIEKSGKQAEQAEDGFTVLKGAVATFAGNVLTTLVSKTLEAGRAILNLSESTREYRRTLATLETAADDVGVSTDYIKDKFTDLMGVFDDQDSVTEGLNNLLTAGFDEKSLDGITTALEGAALKWKDTLKFEGLSDSLQEWIGSGGANLTGNFAELLERLGYNLEEVQAKTKGMSDEQRRNYAVTLLNKEGLDDVSNSYREQNKDLVEAQKANIEWQNSLAEAGTIIEPITTRIREGFTKLLDKVLELVKDVDFEELGAKITVAFDNFINNILPKIVEGLQWIIDNKDGLITGILAIGAAFAAFKVVSLIQSVITALKGMTAAQTALNLAMSLNPIGLIVAAIAALVAAFVYAWNNVDGFKEFWVNAWKSMLDGFEKAINWIVTGFNSMVDWFKQLPSKISQAINKAVDAVKEWGVNLVNAGKKAAGDLLDKILDTFADIKDKFLETGENIVDGIWEGIKNGAKWLKDKITGFAGDVAGWFKDTFKINSPSKLMADEVGLYIGEGIGEGILDSMPHVKKNLSKFSGFVTGNLGDIKNGLGSTGVYSGTNSVPVGKGDTTINAGMTVNYNGKLSRKELKRLENDNWTTIKMKLRSEGVI